MENILNDSLSCPICLDLCQDPVESSCCNHLYCKKCSDAIANTCSLCKRKCDFKRSLLAKRMINMIPVNCEHCSYQCTIGDLNEHLKKCEENKLLCPIKTCHEFFKRSKMIEHLFTTHNDDLTRNLDKISEVLNVGGNRNEFAGNINSESQCSISIEKTKNDKGFEARLGSSGKYFCGQKLDVTNCNCCNGYCGPTNGCNCSSCMKLDLKIRNLPKGWLVNTGGQAARMKNGHFYCGRRVLVGVSNCDGYCGPTNGPNCDSCKKLDAMCTNGGRYANLI